MKTGLWQSRAQKCQKPRLYQYWHSYAQNHQTSYNAFSSIYVRERWDDWQQSVTVCKCKYERCIVVAADCIQQLVVDLKTCVWVKRTVLVLRCYGRLWWLLWLGVCVDGQCLEMHFKDLQEDLGPGHCLDGGTLAQQQGSRLEDGTFVQQ